MKFTLSWLKEHLKTNASIEEIIERLTQLGLEVEEVDSPAVKYKNFILGTILNYKKHPDADRLKICTVNIGEKNLSIICGGNNVKETMNVALALPGAIVPNTNILIKKGKIRGVESEGMLCSSEELNLEKGPEGSILEVNTNCAPGTPLHEVLELDPTIHLSITPNRGDCFSVRGIARDLAASGLGQLIALESPKFIKAKEKKPPIDTDQCYAFYIAHLKNIKNQTSPDYIKKRLEAIGVKSQNFLVDITNYIAFDIGQPMHIHDAKQITAIGVRNAKKGENLECLDDKTYELDQDDLVIASESLPLAIAGIMGSKISAVNEKTDEIFIESALFNPVSIALTGQKLNLNSESRTRFERNVDYNMVKYAFYKVIEIVQKICGGEIIEKYIYEKLPPQKNLIFDTNLFEKKSGFKVTKDIILNNLENLGMQCQELDSNTLKIKIPPWRHDIEIPEDIIEEILRLEGYDKLTPTPLPLKTPQINTKNNIKELLKNRGLIECYTWSFTNPEKFKLFTAEESIEIKNPISQEMSVMRPTLLINLLDITVENLNRGLIKTAFFEIAKTYHRNLDTQSINEDTCIAGLRTNFYNHRQWYEHQREVDCFDAKADSLCILNTYGISEKKLKLEQSAPCYYHPGKSGTWKQGKNIIGYFGEIHPKVLQKYGLKGPCTAFEIFTNLFKVKKKQVKTIELSPYPMVPRDLSFIVEESIPAQDITDTIQNINKDLIHNIHVFDIYKGTGIEAGKKAIGVQFTLQSRSKTLNETEIQTIINEILEKVKKHCNGELRPI